MTAEQLIRHLKQARTKIARHPDPERMSDDDAIALVEKLALEAHEEIENRVALWWEDIRESNRRIRLVNKSWDPTSPGDVDRELWKELVEWGVITKDDLDFILEVLAMYSW
jgi:hypothetical protein